MSNDGKVTARSNVKPKRNWARIKVPGLLRMVSPFSFLWIPLVLGCLLTFSVKGTPHILFEYSYSGSKNFKTSCTYVGLHPQRMNPIGNDCPIFRLLQAKT